MRSSRPTAWIFLLAFGLPLTVVAAEKEKIASSDQEPGLLSAKTFKGLELRGIGPALMSGRIADIAVHPHDQSVWYVAVGSGGVWKTENAATTWSPIFENEGSYSIGAVAIDPNEPSVVWVGTGENVSGRHVGYGDGIYKSLDGGRSWANTGLQASEHISTILIDPRDSNVAFVAVQGPLWSPGGDRGLYKTTDGGETWNKILGGGEYTGVNDVVMDPRDPDVLYASTHERYRNVAALIDGGPESGIHKTTDGGATWRELVKGLPVDEKSEHKGEDMGKIGLAISPQSPDIVYAAIELAHRKGGFWRSTDGGASWEKRSDYVAGGTGPHYYQEIWASPHQFDRVYHADVRLHVTEDGGTTFRSIGNRNKHVDNHAMAFDPNDPNYLLVGCDGGLYESWDLGKNWKFIANLPVTQFYKVAVDYDEPFYNVYGGTQDNNTQGGPSRTDNVHGIRNADWFITLFGDGHQPAADPTNPDIIYAQWQQGNLMRHDRKTGEITYIQPQPAADEEWERLNWDAPILISSHDPARLYHASQRIWRSDNRGDSWRPVSGDLTRGLDRLELPMMGRVQSFDAVWDLYAMSKFSTITSLAESPLDENLLYAGTDDGLIQVSEDGGETWRAIDRLPGVPQFFFVNDLKADLFDVDTVYVIADDHKSGDFSPYILKSTDRGRSWQSITGDLPARHIVWRLVQDHENPLLLFAGTEFGVFFTIDGGAKWIKLEGGVPNIPFRDLAIQRRENDLVGATFGRSFYILDDYTPLRTVSEKILEQEAALFPVRTAWWYVPRRTLGRGEQASQGAAYFVAPNPPFGAVFTYYLKDELETSKANRRKKERDLEKQGQDTPYPGWEAVRAEREEEDPAIILTVRDVDGNVVRRLTGPTTAGFHRVAWDLRYPSSAAWKPQEEDEDSDEEDGYLAAPGSYSVNLAKRVGGVVTDLVKQTAFEVEPLSSTAAETAGAAVAFLRELDATRRNAAAARAAIEETELRLAAIRETLMRSTVGGTDLDDEVRSLEKRLSDMKLALVGDEQRSRLGDPGPVSIDRRLQVAHFGNAWSTAGPSTTHRMSLDVAKSALDALRGALDEFFAADLPALEAKLDAAGVPWTPGRSGGRE
ncbi:MAG: glycosyl hydrolase [Acidobacteriota bacterium]|nr:glycosyl hydrolase [Acidobacteriota bacterium]